MAERRMFTKKIIDSDAFLDMPLSTQALYFHLNMRADDDGFIDNPKKICRMIGCSEDDLKLLIEKRFVLTFENGVIVIKHWRMHNAIRKDRYIPTQYTEQFAEIELKDNGTYTERKEPIETDSFSKYMNPPEIEEVEEKQQKPKTDTAVYKEIIEYLNEKAGTSYKVSTKKTQQVIHARIAEGFGVEDFKKVIDTKVNEWAGTDMDKFIRPETLFGTKFESYLNQKQQNRRKNIFAGNAHDLDDLDGCF